MENAITRWLGSWRRRLMGHGALDRFYAQHQTDLELLLRAEEVPQHLVDAYRQLTQDAASGVTWDHLHRLEGLLLQAAPDGYRRLALATIRVRFKALAPAELYEEYVKLVAPRVDGANQPVASELTLKDEGIYLLSQLQRLRVLHAEYSRARRFIFLLMPVVVGAYLGLLNLVVYVFAADKSSWNPPLSILIFAAGLIGAFFSAATRLSAVTFGSAFTLNYQEVGKFYKNYFANLLFAMSEGGLAALILWMALVARLLEGVLFPEVAFDHTVDGIATALGGAVPAGGSAPMADLASGKGLAGPELFASFLSAHPSDYRGYGKMFILCFLAGFSERLVPDFLDRTTSTMTAATAAKSPLPSLPALAPGGRGAG